MSCRDVDPTGERTMTGRNPAAIAPSLARRDKKHPYFSEAFCRISASRNERLVNF
jgi:hypothetical protein